MYQTLARIIGTVIVSKLLAWHWIPAGFGLTPEQIEYVGDAVLVAAIWIWSYLEKRAKGLTQNSPNPPSNIPTFKTPVRELNTLAKIASLNPTPEENKIP